MARIKKAKVVVMVELDGVPVLKELVFGEVDITKQLKMDINEEDRMKLFGVSVEGAIDIVKNYLEKENIQVDFKDGGGAE